jgi:Bacterial PH domain/zinc-ribbon domain
MIDRLAVANISKELLPNEKVEMTIRQRHFGPGGSVTPTILIATNRRLIIIYKTNLGFKTVHEIIAYNKITTVRLERGIISSTIHLHVLGVEEQMPTGDNRIEEEFSGLKHKSAEALVNFLNGKISKESRETSGGVEDYVYCSKCGAKVAPAFAYCPNCGTVLVK